MHGNQQSLWQSPPSAADFSEYLWQLHKYNKSCGRVETAVSCLGIADGRVTYRWVIRDTGIGMSKEFLQHIFTPFSQERSDSTRQGTGLGMAIVKSLIDEMQGTIT